MWIWIRACAIWNQPKRRHVKLLLQLSQRTPDPNDPATENRAYENAYAALKRGNHAEAIKAFRIPSAVSDSAIAGQCELLAGSCTVFLKEYKGHWHLSGLLKHSPTPQKPGCVFSMANASAS